MPTIPFTLPHKSGKGLAASTPSPLSRHCGGCEVLLQSSLPQAAKAPPPQPMVMTQCSSPEHSAGEFSPSYQCLSALKGVILAIILRYGLTTSARQQGQPLSQDPGNAPPETAPHTAGYLCCYGLIPDPSHLTALARARVCMLVFHSPWHPPLHWFVELVLNLNFNFSNILCQWAPQIQHTPCEKVLSFLSLTVSFGDPWFCEKRWINFLMQHTIF